MFLTLTELADRLYGPESMADVSEYIAALEMLSALTEADQAEVENRGVERHGHLILETA